MNLPNTQKEVTVSVELKPSEELEVQCSCSQCNSSTCFVKRHATETCRNCETSKKSLFFSADNNITHGKSETLNGINDNVGKEYIEKQIIYEYDKAKDITRIINKQSRVFTYRTDSKHKFDEKTIECIENPPNEYRSINDANSRKNNKDENTVEFNENHPNVDQSIAVPISQKTDKGKKMIDYVGIPPNEYQKTNVPDSQKNCVCPSLVEHNEISPNEYQRIQNVDIQKKCVCASAVKCNGITPNAYQRKTVSSSRKDDKDKNTIEHVGILPNEYQSMTVSKSQKNCVCPSLVQRNEIPPNEYQSITVPSTQKDDKDKKNMKYVGVPSNKYQNMTVPKSQKNCVRSSLVQRNEIPATEYQRITVPDIQKKCVCASEVECNGITPNEYQSITVPSSRKDDIDKNTMKYVRIPPNEYQSVIVPKSQKNCPSAGELKAQIMDVPYKQFEQSLSRQKPETVSNFTSISPYDIFQKIKEVYNACSCKVCQCIVGKSLKNDLCKCKPCECEDCTSFIKKIKSETKSSERIRTRIKKKSKYCNCEPCECSICCTDSLPKLCNCKPCQCVECKSMVIKRRTMVIAPVGEGYRNERHGCDCSPCQCIECQHGYSVPLNVTHHEMSTGVSRHPQCQCEACDNDACLPDGTNTCLCVRPDRVMRKPVQRDNDYDIRTAVLTPTCICGRGGDAIKYRHDTIAMFAAITDNYPEYLTKKNQCSCSQCECITCSYKEDIVNAVNSSSTFETNACMHNLRNNENSCKCSLCECQFCTNYKHKKLENYSSSINNFGMRECDERTYLDCTKTNKSKITTNTKTINRLASFSKCRCDTCECTKCEKILPQCTGDICNCLSCRCQSCIAKDNLSDVVNPVKKGGLLTSTVYRHKVNDSFLKVYGNRALDEKNFIGVSHNVPKNINEKNKFRDVPVDDYQKCGLQINEISRQQSHPTVKNKIDTPKSGHLPSNVSNAFLTKVAVDYKVSLTNISANSSAFYRKDSGSITPVSGLPNKSWESSLNSSGYDYPNYLVQFPKSTAEACLNDVLKFNLDTKTLDAIKPSSKLNFARKPFKNATIINDYQKNVNSDYLYMPVLERPLKTIRKQDLLKLSYDECSFVDKKNLSPEQVSCVSPYRNFVTTQTEDKNSRWDQRNYNEYSKNVRKASLCTGKSLNCPSMDNNADFYTLEEDYDRVQKTLLEARAFSQKLAELLVKYEKANREFESVSQKLKFANNVAENILTSYSNGVSSNIFINGGRELPKDDESCPCIRCNRGSCKGINKNSPEPCQCVQSECKISNKSYSELNATGSEAGDIPIKEQKHVKEEEITHSANNYPDNEENRIGDVMAKLTLDAENMLKSFSDGVSSNIFINGGRVLPKDDESCPCIRCNRGSCKGINKNSHEACQCVQSECKISNKSYSKLNATCSEADDVPIKEQKYVKEEEITHSANNYRDNAEKRIGDEMANLTLDAENMLTSFSDEVSSNIFINGGRVLPKEDDGCPCIRCNRGSCKGINKNSHEACLCVQSECKISKKSYSKLNASGSEAHDVPIKEQKYVKEEEITYSANNYRDNEENRIGDVMANLTLDAESLINKFKNSNETKTLHDTVKSSQEKMREIQICDSNDSNLKCVDEHEYEDCKINLSENIANINNCKMFLDPVVEENETINDQISGATKQRTKKKKLNKFNKMYKRSSIVLSKGIKRNATNITEKIVTSVEIETETSNTLIIKVINDKNEGDIKVTGDTFKQTMNKNVTEKGSTLQMAIKTKLTLSNPQNCLEKQSTDYKSIVVMKTPQERERSDISCESLKVKLLTARGVADHTVIVKWNAPKNLNNVVGYEVSNLVLNGFSRRRCSL